MQQQLVVILQSLISSKLEVPIFISRSEKKGLFFLYNAGMITRKFGLSSSARQGDLDLQGNLKVIMTRKTSFVKFKGTSSISSKESVNTNEITA